MNHTHRSHRDARNLDSFDRIINAALGCALIGTVFTHATNETLGWLSLLPIIAIYPCLTAITGYSPIRGALSAIAQRTQQRRSDYAPLANSHVDVFAH